MEPCAGGSADGEGLLILVMKFARRLLTLCLLVLPACANALPLDSIKLPPGFTIELWARVDNAREMALGGTDEKGGVLYVGSRGAGRVHAVRFDANYRADS